jgi:Protein of unknown function (DUF3224)
VRVVHTIVSARFEVTDWKEEPIDDRSDAAKMTRAAVTKSYSGGIKGDSVTEWLMAYADDGSAAFVGVERIVGMIGGRTGTLVVQHVGAYESGAATAQLHVLGGCGTGELAGATGTGGFVADPAGSVELTLDFGSGRATSARGATG